MRDSSLSWWLFIILLIHNNNASYKKRILLSLMGKEYQYHILVLINYYLFSIIYQSLLSFHHLSIYLSINLYLSILICNYINHSELYYILYGSYRFITFVVVKKNKDFRINKNKNNNNINYNTKVSWMIRDAVVIIE